MDFSFRLFFPEKEVQITGRAHSDISVISETAKDNSELGVACYITCCIRNCIYKIGKAKS